MTEFTGRLDRAAAAATCGVLTSGGSALIGAGAWGVAGGGAGFGAIGVGAAALMAANYLNCPGGWDPGGTPAPGGGPPQQLCYEGDSLFTIRQLQNGVFKGGSTPEIRRITKITFDGNEECQTGGSRDGYTIFWEDAANEPGDTGFFHGGPCGGTSYSWEQVFEGSSICLQPGPPPGPNIPPTVYNDVDSGCSLTVNFKGFASTSSGKTNPVYKIETTPELRSGDGTVGGCNFEPVLYYGDPNGGPPVVGPWDPEWDQEGDDPFPWGPVLDEIAEGIGDAASKEDLDEKFDTPLAEVVYRLRSVCEVDANGNPVQEFVEVPIPELAPWDAITARLDALIPLLQGQKDFKQPICPPVKAQGELRTIGFISEDYSPNGRNYLRKRLRYRSVSGLGLDALIDHWKNFEFDAGPVIVKHIGSSWGTVTVWAASATEGKRVILHAAREAGIDADQSGRWEISGSSSTRLGMPGSMKVNTAGGYYWITARDGSNARPMVGTI